MAKNEVAVIEKKVTPLVAKAENHKIETEKDLAEAVSMLSQMNKYGDSIKEEKEKITKPARAIINAESKRWKPLEDMYDRGISILRRSMSDYQTKKVAAADKQAADIAKRVGEGKGKLKPETAVRKMEEIETPSKEVATTEGLVQFREVKKYRLLDIKKVPFEFLVPNDAAIGKAMKEGTELPGIEYYIDQVPVNYR